MDETQAKVREIASKILKIKVAEIGIQDDLITKFGMDSMRRVEIIIELENVFDVNIPDDDAGTLRTVQQLTNYISGVLSKK